MNKEKAAYQKVGGAIRERIRRGEWGPNERLPSRDELAAEYKTSVFTIHRALTPLVEEGVIERKRRTGTVVSSDPAVLTCAGIYGGDWLVDEWEFAFYRELTRELQRQLGGQQVQSRMFADMRPLADRVAPMPELVQAIESRTIQALFVVLCDNSTLWLTHLPVAASFSASYPIPNRVGVDTEQFLRLGLTRLREQGCRTVGFISAVEVPRDHHSSYFQMYEVFIGLVVELGLTVRDPWAITPTGHILDHEAYGYEAFRRLWAADEHPDGLLVYPDTSARGVMTAALELGVRVPEDLKMVFHHNTGVDWICPLGVDWVESDTTAWAAAMIEQVRRQKAGKAVTEPTVMGYRLVEGGREGARR